MKWIIIILSVLLSAGSARADLVDLVKMTKNSLGIHCSEIPKVMEQKLGYKNLISRWLEDKMDGLAQVSLKISAQKEMKVDSLYVSYAWNPEWIWQVEGRKVSPKNALARDWMAGRL